MANASIEAEPHKKVKEVVKEFLLKGDESLAINLQDKEYDEKYEWNRFQGKLARTDVPLAKQTYTEEEKRLQIERMKQLKEINSITERDAQIIQEFLDKEEKEKKEIQRQQQEAAEKLALDIQRQELERNKEQLFKDLEMAKNLDKQDSSYVIEDFQTLHFGDEDYDDVNEQKTIQALQDEELARALQEHENKKAAARQKSQIEYDAQLVRQIQNKENDKLKRSKSDKPSNDIIQESEYSEIISSPPVYSQVIKKDKSSGKIGAQGDTMVDQNRDNNFNDAITNSKYTIVEKTIVTTTKHIENGKEKIKKTTSVQKFLNKP